MCWCWCCCCRRENGTPALPAITPNFERLVLFCMDSYDSERGRIFQHFLRSTRSTYLRTAPTSKIQLKFVKLFAKLNIEYSIFCIFSLNFAVLRPNFDEISPKFRQNFQKMLKSVERVMRFCEKLTKFPINYSQFSGILKKFEFFD